MIDGVVAAGKKTGCPTGIHAMDVESALARAKQGMQFIAVASDLRFMSQAAQAALKAVNPEASGKEVARY